MMYSLIVSVSALLLLAASHVGGQDIVGYTPGAPDPGTVLPPPTGVILALGSVVVVDVEMKSSMETTGAAETMAYVEGTCTAVNEPSFEEVAEGSIFQKLFCDLVYDFGASCENSYECEDIIAVSQVLVLNNDPDTNGVGVVTGGSGKYAGVGGEIITRDPANFGGAFAQQNFYLTYPNSSGVYGRMI